MLLWDELDQRPQGARVPHAVKCLLAGATLPRWQPGRGYCLEALYTPGALQVCHRHELIDPQGVAGCVVACM